MDRVVLSTLTQGPVYFSELRQAIPGISDRILNERLLELAELNLVERTVLQARPMRVHRAAAHRSTSGHPRLEPVS